MSAGVRQRGISLLIAMVVLLLSTLLAMWALRTSQFNELMTGNDSDYQRALEAAQAMVRDAEFDIRNQKADGSSCTGTVCRQPVIDAGTKQAFFPEDIHDYQDLETALVGATPSCIEGICIAKNVRPQFWVRPADFEVMKPVAATYGKYTGAQAGSAGNPLLKTTSDAETKAWYWVEVLPYDMSSAVAAGPAQLFAPDTTRPNIYRITGIAQGLKPGTQAVVQSVLVWRKVGS